MNDYSTDRVYYHLINREESVDVEQVPPPVLGAGLVVHGWRLEDGVVREPLHGHLDHAQHE